MKSLGGAALEVLTASQPEEKAAKSIIFATMWREGSLAPETKTTPPDRPSRPKKPELLAPSDMPKRRKGGTKANKIALLHAIAHIELNAIDLAWDMVARFGAGMPKGFLDDWVEVGADEARHFTLLTERLAAEGAAYGDLPAHDGLWQAAFETRNDFLGRLAVVPLVLEARGLDVTPAMIARFRKNGDDADADVLEVIYAEEIDHVKAGAKWFRHQCREKNLDPKATWQDKVQSYFKGQLKPPFNIDARDLAGLSSEFYLPLAKKD